MWVILSRPDCPWCDKAEKLLLLETDEDYEFIDLAERENKWVRNLLLKCEITTVPQIFTPEGKHIGGYHDLKRYFDD